MEDDCRRLCFACDGAEVWITWRREEKQSKEVGTLFQLELETWPVVNSASNTDMKFTSRLARLGRSQPILNNTQLVSRRIH